MITLKDIQSFLTTKCTESDLEEAKGKLDKKNPDDELWNFRWHPAPLIGFAGIALVRKGKVIKYIQTKIY